MIFNSNGHAWQYAIDHLSIEPEQLFRYAEQSGMSATSIVELAADFESRGWNVKEKLEEAVQEREVKSLEDQLHEIETESAAGYLQEFLNGISESVNTPVFKTGFPKLDKALNGGFREGLQILGGATSIGKSSFVLQVADQLASQGHDILFYSLEMSRNDLIAKSVSRHTCLHCLNTGLNIAAAKSMTGITDGALYDHYSKEEREVIERAMSQYGEYANHLHIREGNRKTSVEDIRTEANRIKTALDHSPIIVVDYIQLLARVDNRLSDKQNVDENLLKLWQISRDFKTPVFGISSINRSSYSKPVSYSSFKESGSVEYDSDVLMGYHLAGTGQDSFDEMTAKKANPRNMELVFLKNKKGMIGDAINYKYYPAFNLFEEVEV